METPVPPLTLWKGASVRTNDYKLIDRLVGEEYRVGGTEMYIHKYLGPIPQGATGDATQPNTALDAVNSDSANVLQIQDVLNMEIRDRKYDPDVFSLKGHYAITDTEFDLRQFGLFLSNETIFITFHINDMVASIGRTLMSGDVIEIPHRRDDLALGDFSLPKYYVVQEGARPAEGYSPTWWPHIWRVKCDPMPAGQEYNDILNRPATDINGDPVIDPQTGQTPTLNQMLSTYDRELAINDAILEEAEKEVPFRNLQGQSYYVLEGDLNDPVTIWAGDGIPPNQSKPVQQGVTFPQGAPAGTWILRVDYNPPILFKRVQVKPNVNVWKKHEINYRKSWTPANRVLESFINNNTTTTLQDGSTIDERQNLRTAIKPKLDPDII